MNLEGLTAIDAKAYTIYRMQQERRYETRNPEYCPRQLLARPARMMLEAQ